MRRHYQGRLAQRYDQQWAAFTATMLAPVLALASEGLQAGMPVLDAGCGTGWLLQQLAARQAGLHLNGTDASTAMIAQARAKLGDRARLFVLNLNDPLPSDLRHAGPFDLILCTNVAHYLRDPVRSLRDLAGCLAPGGRMIVADFTRHGWWWPAYDVALHLADAQHHRTLTATELAEVVRAAGLRITATQPIPAGFPWRGTLVAGTTA